MYNKKVKAKIMQRTHGFISQRLRFLLKLPYLSPHSLMKHTGTHRIEVNKHDYPIHNSKNL